MLLKGFYLTYPASHPTDLGWMIRLLALDGQIAERPSPLVGHVMSRRLSCFRFGSLSVDGFRGGEVGGRWLFWWWCCVVGGGRGGCEAGVGVDGDGGGGDGDGRRLRNPAPLIRDRLEWIMLSAFFRRIFLKEGLSVRPSVRPEGGGRKGLKYGEELILF